MLFGVLEAVWCEGGSCASSRCVVCYRVGTSMRGCEIEAGGLV